jgi:hypothetical protein
MARSLFGEIFHQLTSNPYNPPKYKKSYCNNKSYNSKPKKDNSYERMAYKYKQQAFENKKDFEIKKLQSKSKGWI